MERQPYRLVGLHHTCDILDVINQRTMWNWKLKLIRHLHTELG
jgi:hypothetical protein